MATPAKAHRSQADRRAETEAKLVEATIQTVVEKGYAQISAKEICGRAGLSHGALFARFDSLLNLVLAAAAEVGRRQVARFTSALAQLPDPPEIIDVLRVARDSARNPINFVWTELKVAARTDPVVRAELATVHESYVETIATTALQLPGLRDLSPKRAITVCAIVLDCFDGEAVRAVPYPVAELESAYLRTLAEMVENYLADYPAAP